MMEDIRPVITKKYDLEYWDNFFNNSTFWKLRVINILVQKIAKSYPIESTSKVGGYAIETVMEDNNPVVTEKIEFQWGDESKSIARYKVFELLSFWGNEENQWIFESTSTKIRFFIEFFTKISKHYLGR